MPRSYLHLLYYEKVKPMRLYLILSLLVALNFHCPLNAQNDYSPPVLSDPDSWTMILLGDPQTYMKFSRNQGIFELMTAWISENIDPLNIQMVLCTGDLVEQNEILIPDYSNGNQTSRSQWVAVSRAFERLDGKVPFVLAAGNHDYGFNNISHRRSNYDQYFPAHRNSSNVKILKEVGKNAEGKPTLENAAFEFISPHNRKFLFMNLEFAPRDTILQWASSVIGKEAYQGHTVVLLTHSYLNAQNEPIEIENYPIEEGNYGKAVWDKLVSPSRNIQLVFSGHVGADNDFRSHTGFKSDHNADGRKINQMTFNAQALGGGRLGNGGDGWLRIYEFLPDGKTVKVHTFSPFFAISPSTRHLARNLEPYNDFTFTLD